MVIFDQAIRSAAFSKLASVFLAGLYCIVRVFRRRWIQGMSVWRYFFGPLQYYPGNVPRRSASRRFCWPLFCALAGSVLPAGLAAAPTLLLGSHAIYKEEIFNPQLSVSGSDDLVPESISAGGATVSLSSTPFAFVESPLAPIGPIPGNPGVIGYLALPVTAVGTIDFLIQLKKLHPDAPDQLAIPIRVTTNSSFSMADPLVHNRTSATPQVLINSQVLCNNLQGLPCNGVDQLPLFAGDFGTIRVTAFATEGRAQISGPIFEIDPTFMVPFFDGTMQRAVDLYTLGISAGIDAVTFETNINTPTTGCLNDPGILLPDGTSSLKNGAAVTCRLRDPSGYLAVGFNDLNVTVLDGATVESPGPGHSSLQAMQLNGSNNKITNVGTIESNSDGDAVVMLAGAGETGGQLVNGFIIQTDSANSDAVVMSGTGSKLQNIASGLIETHQVFSDAVSMAGDHVTVNNDGIIRTHGAESDGIAVDPDPLGANPDFANHASVINSALIEITGDGSSAVSIAANNSRFENSGTITTTGNFSPAIALAGTDDNTSTQGIEITGSGSVTTSGNDSTAITAIGSGHQVRNTGGTITTAGDRSHGMALGLEDIVLPPGAPVPAGLLDPADGTLINDTNGVITTTGSESHGIQGHANQSVFENRGTITAGVLLTTVNNRGMRVAGNDNHVLNTHQVTALGDDSVAMDVQGDNAVVENGDLAHRTASLSAQGISATGLTVDGAGASIINEGDISVTGPFAPGGIRLTAQAGSGYQVTSAGNITLGGINPDGAVGMQVIAAGTTGAPAGLSGSSCALIDDGTSKLVNCGTIQFTNSTAGAGMSANEVVATTVENQKQINGSGPGAFGMVVQSGADPGTGLRNNLISNVDTINITGDGATGISVTGDRNVILNGSGLLTFPASPIPDPVELQDPFGTSLFPNGQQFSNEFVRSTHTGTTIPVGSMLVSGLNAVGISITGNNNRAGQLFSGQSTDTFLDVPGAGSIGVKMSGDGNVFVNGGAVASGGIAVLGGAGSDTLINQNSISGDIDLRGGADQMIIDAGSQLAGIADGGAGVDSLVVFVSSDDPLSYAVDGSRYVNFENFAKIGGGTMSLTNSLQVTEADLIVGTLNETSTARLITSGNTTRIHPGARLTGDGTTVGRVVVTGGVLAPGTDNMTGTLTILGDVQLIGGIIELAAVSLADTDHLDILGNATFSGGFLDVLFGFTPNPDDVVDLLVNAQTLILAGGFQGIRGFAAAGSDVPIGTPFQVNLGGQLFQGTVAAPVPLPAAAWLFVSTLIGLLAKWRNGSKSSAARHKYAGARMRRQLFMRLLTNQAGGK